MSNETTEPSGSEKFRREVQEMIDAGEHVEGFAQPAEDKVDIQAQIADLAAMTSKCPNCQGKNPTTKYAHSGKVTRGPCDGYKGTMRVPTFLSLRRVCNTTEVYRRNRRGDPIYDTCRKCQGKGWLPVTFNEIDGFALLVEAWSLNQAALSNNVLSALVFAKTRINEGVWDTPQLTKHVIKSIREAMKGTAQ